MAEAEGQTLGELRKSGPSWKQWWRKHCPWLFDIHSLFYYGLFIFVVGIAWTFFSLLTNGGTQLYNWDYNSQYVSFTYDFWDTWHDFFKTGYFALYDPKTYLGTDNIGSNSYYGLFDPFLILCYIFPRAWIPQTFAFATFFKAMAGAFAMRAYLKYMKVSEGPSRLGGLCFAYSGFINFFVGFPSFVSMAFAVPLILLGIEKVLREKKISCLVFGLFLMGIISFFFLVVICIFGVIYAIWRYFWTMKTRSKRDNWLVIPIGILSFVLGLTLCAWTLLPSIRESSLSGRTESVGSAYLALLKTALASFNVGDFFSLMFAPVGSNGGRELMGLISFFYPTCNYLQLPLAKSFGGASYDAWTSSLFCYTPMVILFWTGVFGSFRRKEKEPLIAIPLCCYLLFTTFAYYFFYAFAGDGYGRWFIVLVPLIIFYGCQELDRLKDEPAWVLPCGSLTAVLGTGLAFLITYLTLEGVTFERVGTYFPTNYNVPGIWIDNSAIAHSLLWLVFYQMMLVVVESIIIIYRQKKPDLWKILSGFVTMEIIVAGNISFAYGSLWSYQNNFLGGVTNAEKTNALYESLRDYDSENYYRIQTDAYPEANAPMAFGFNGTSNFHSLYNFDVSALSRMSHIVGNDSSYTRYGKTINAVSWSGYYGNKRFGLDTALGTRYYIVKNEGYQAGGKSFLEYQPANVPFGAKEVSELSTANYRVYENPYYDQVPLGHAVDSLYAEKRITGSTVSDFYGTSRVDEKSGDTFADTEILRNEEVYLDGAIIKDKDVTALANDFTFSSTPETAISSTHLTPLSYSGRIITTYSNYEEAQSDSTINDVYDYTYFGSHTNRATKTTEYYSPAYFLTHLNDSNIVSSVTQSTYGTLTKDYQKMVYYPAYNYGGYFNTDPTGAYFVLSIPHLQSTLTPRIYFVGDTYESDGKTKKEENVVLSYEWADMQNWTALGSGCDYRAKTFGFYAQGRVKWIVYCYKNWAGSTMVYQPSIYMANRSVIETEMSKLSSPNYALSNVVYHNGGFTFDTAFTSKRLVVTSLGFDAGWQATATDASGKKTTLSMYNLDGGFVGFVAPEGATSYTLSYLTPYLKVGATLSAVGMLGYGAYQIGYFWLALKKERAELALIDPNDDKKKKA